MLKWQKEHERVRSIGGGALAEPAPVQGDDALRHAPFDACRRALHRGSPANALDPERHLDAAGERLEGDVHAAPCRRAFREPPACCEQNRREPDRIDEHAVLVPRSRVAHPDRPTEELRSELDHHARDEIDRRFAAAGGLSRLLSLYEQLQRELERVSYEEIDRMTGDIKGVIETLLTMDYELRRVNNLKLAFDATQPGSGGPG